MSATLRPHPVRELLCDCIGMAADIEEGARRLLASVEAAGDPELQQLCRDVLRGSEQAQSECAQLLFCDRFRALLSTVPAPAQTEGGQHVAR